MVRKGLALTEWSFLRSILSFNPHVRFTGTLQLRCLFCIVLRWIQSGYSNSTSYKMRLCWSYRHFKEQNLVHGDRDIFYWGEFFDLHPKSKKQVLRWTFENAGFLPTQFILLYARVPGFQEYVTLSIYLMRPMSHQKNKQNKTKHKKAKTKNKQTKKDLHCCYQRSH